MSKNQRKPSINNQLSQKIKMLRESHNMSQYELADALGCSREKIYRYENGIQRPDFHFIDAIAQYFNVNINYFSTTQGGNLEGDTRKAS